MKYTIDVKHDEEADVYIATSEDIPGLVLEDESLPNLKRRLRDAIPDLIMKPTSVEFKESYKQAGELFGKAKDSIDMGEPEDDIGGISASMDTMLSPVLEIRPDAVEQFVSALEESAKEPPVEHNVIGRCLEDPEELKEFLDKVIKRQEG